MRQHCFQFSALSVSGVRMSTYSGTYFISEKKKLWNISAYACTMIATSPFLNHPSRSIGRKIGLFVIVCFTDVSTVCWYQSMRDVLYLHETLL